MSAVSIFVAGADAFGCAVAALLFLRARFRTQDYLFVFFSAAFALLAVNECMLVIERLRGEGTALSDLVRLLAFALILGAIGYRSIARHSH
jgi:hypothetical protein